MDKIKIFILVGLVLVAAAGVWLGWPQPITQVSSPKGTLSGLMGGEEPLLPLPAALGYSEAKVKLGAALFSEVRLSADNTQSCASCHDLAHAGIDRKRFSVGVGQAVGTINAPTVFNSGLNFVQFWDGRAASLEEQVPGPVHNPIEMASNWAQVLSKLKADPTYRYAFERVYQDGITAANITDAIATFERTLVTTGSRFDRYLLGERGAISELEASGYRRFKEYGCASCHQGVGVGANMYQRFGVMADYFSNRQVGKSDLGRFNVTGLEEDRHVFKVPGLRNVAVTAPYFHDGSVATLEEAVMIMGRYQLGRDLTQEDVTAISAFLRSLTGQWQGQYLQ
jgi:cytochrome c peroxidase